MPFSETRPPTVQQRLRLWPGVVAVVLQWLVWLVVPIVVSGSAGSLVGVAAGFLGTVVVVAWWLFFSRAPRVERWGAVALMALAVLATPPLLHESVAAGNMGFQFYLYVVPTLSLGLVAGALLGDRLRDGPRRLTMMVAILLACGAWTLVRSEGLRGDGFPEFTWRWASTPEEQLLARTGGVPGELPAASAAGRADWPGLRGPGRDGVVPGLRIATDWALSPPVELWRRPVGPGVSSFAVGGDLLYTQEQRGEDEVVSCYRLSSGEPVWMHRDAARFWDSHVGAGPRATPALHDGRVFALGATGILNALDGRDGTVLWSRQAAADTDTEVPYFGFTSSPLVIDDVVVVHVGRLVAYELDTGEPRWIGPADGGSYGSPQLLELQGTPQILLLTHAGAAGFAPADGARLWEHAWPGIGIGQPVPTATGDLLIGNVNEAAAPVGTRRIRVAPGADGWAAEERWTSIRLKTSFSAFVVHQGHAFGFDGGILASIDVDDGGRDWKGGRYGHGQLLLLPDQDLLLVVTESGELALVQASPERFVELARRPGIEGRTWNQPALVRDVLLVRNGQEMAAFRLPAAED